MTQRLLERAARPLDRLVSRTLYYHGVFCASHRALAILFCGALIVAASLPVYLSACDSVFNTDLAEPFEEAVKIRLGLDPGRGKRRLAQAEDGQGSSHGAEYAIISRIIWDCGEEASLRCLAQNVTLPALGTNLTSNLFVGLLALEWTIENTADPVTGKTLNDICYRTKGTDGCAKLSATPCFVDPPLTGPPHPFAIRDPAIDRDNGNVLSASGFIWTYLVEGKGMNGEVWLRIRGALLERGLASKTVHTWDPPLSEANLISTDPPRVEPRTAISRVKFAFTLNHLLIIISYLIVFLYISLSLGRVELVKSKFGLGVTAITTVFASLTMSMGILEIAGVQISLIQWEVLPFLIIAVGVENIFVITNGVTTTAIDLPVNERVGRGLGKVGASITVALFGELAIFVLGTATSIPPLQEFSLFASVAVVVDYFLQITFFTTVLSIDFRRLELSDLSKRRVVEIIRQNSTKALSESANKSNEINAKLAREKVAAQSYQQRTTVLRYVLMVFLAIFGGFLFVELLAKNAYRPAMSVFSSYDTVELDYSYATIDAIVEAAGHVEHPFLRGYKWIEWTETLSFLGHSLPSEAVLGADDALTVQYEIAKAEAALIAAESVPFQANRFPKAAFTTLEIVAVLLVLIVVFIFWTNFLHLWTEGGQKAAFEWLRARLISVFNAQFRTAEQLLADRQASQGNAPEKGSWWETDHEQRNPRGAKETETDSPASHVLAQKWTVATLSARLPDLTDQDHDRLGNIAFLDCTPTDAAWVRSNDRGTLYIGDSTAIESDVDITAIKFGLGGALLAIGRADGTVWVLQLSNGGEVQAQLSSESNDGDSVICVEHIKSAGKTAVLAISIKGLVMVTSVGEDALIPQYSIHSDTQSTVSAVCFSEELACLILGFADGTLERYEISPKVGRKVFSWSSGILAVKQVELVSISQPAASLLLASLAEDGTIRIWNLARFSDASSICSINSMDAARPSNMSRKIMRMAIVVPGSSPGTVIVARKLADDAVQLWRVDLSRSSSRRRDSSRSSRTSSSTDESPLIFRASSTSRLPRSSTPPVAPIKIGSHNRRPTGPSAPSPLVNLGLSTPPTQTWQASTNGLSQLELAEVGADSGQSSTPPHAPAGPPSLSAQSTLLGTIQQPGSTALLGIRDLELIAGVRRRAVVVEDGRNEASSSSEAKDMDWIWEAWIVDASATLTTLPINAVDDSSSSPPVRIPVTRTVYLANDKLSGMGCSFDFATEPRIARDDSLTTLRSIRKVAVEDDVRARFAGSLPVLLVRDLRCALGKDNATFGFCCDFGDSVKRVSFDRERDVRLSDERSSREALEAELAELLDSVMSRMPSPTAELGLPPQPPQWAGTMLRRPLGRRIEAEVGEEGTVPGSSEITSDTPKEKGL